jgi:Endonuclease-reverse transcriptase
LEELAALSDFLSPDIILLTETWTNKNINSAALTIPGYRLEERRDREDTANGIGGGLVIYIKDKYVTLPFSKQNDFNQYTGFRLKTKDRTLTIILVYRLPSSRAENLAKLCELLQDLDSNTLVIGDFNLPGIDWDAQTSDNKGRDLMDVANEEGLVQLVDFQTHKKGNKLDLILSNCPEKVISVTDEGCLGRSDHSLILLKLEINAKFKMPQSQIVCWKKGRYHNIKENLADIDWTSRLRGKSTEEAWDTFKAEIINQVQNEIPTFTPSHRNG